MEKVQTLNRKSDKSVDAFSAERRGKTNIYQAPTTPSVFLYVVLFEICVCVQSYPTLCNPMTPARLLCPQNFPGKNTGVGCHFLLQGIVATQGSNLGLLHCRQILFPLCYLLFCLTLKMPQEGDFPSGPVVKTLCFHYRGQGLGFDPWLGN